MLAEIACANGGSVVNHPLFRRRSRLVSPFLQSYRTRFLHWASTTRDIDQLQGDEVVMGLLRATFDDDGRRRGTCGLATTRLMRRTKEFLQAQLSRRVRLADIGRAVGASPAYLTDVFNRVEGVRDKNRWGFPFRRGLFEIDRADFISIAKAMKARGA